MFNSLVDLSRRGIGLKPKISHASGLPRSSDIQFNSMKTSCELKDLWLSFEHSGQLVAAKEANFDQLPFSLN